MNRSVDGRQAEKTTVEERTRRHIINAQIHQRYLWKTHLELGAENPILTPTSVLPHLLILSVRSHRSYAGAGPVQVAPKGSWIEQRRQLNSFRGTSLVVE